MLCPKHPDAECIEGKSRCQKCLDTLKDYQRTRRQNLLTKGLCVGTVTRSACKNPPREGKTMCAECAQIFNAYQKNRKVVKNVKDT
jgi:hypothetical protein